MMGVFSGAQCVVIGFMGRAMAELWPVSSSGAGSQQRGMMGGTGDLGAVKCYGRV